MFEHIMCYLSLFGGFFLLLLVYLSIDVYLDYKIEGKTEEKFNLFIARLNKLEAKDRFLQDHLFVEINEKLVKLEKGKKK